MNKRKKRHLSVFFLFFVLLFPLMGCEELSDQVSTLVSPVHSESATNQDVVGSYPTEYDGTNQEIVLNNNQPTFTDRELSLEDGVWQTFSDLDQLNRVGVANALIGKESFPKEGREPLTIKPTGWKQKKISGGQWLYNRSHLVGFQLTGENNNMKNLMTGTRSFNTPHMLNYENQIKEYINLTGNHVRYRVTPHFEGNELVARGIQLEAKSVERAEFGFNVYIFNVQEGYTIDYDTGKATKSGS